MLSRKYLENLRKGSKIKYNFNNSFAKTKAI